MHLWYTHYNNHATPPNMPHTQSHMHKYLECARHEFMSAFESRVSFLVSELVSITISARTNTHNMRTHKHTKHKHTLSREPHIKSISNALARCTQKPNLINNNNGMKCGLRARNACLNIRFGENAGAYYITHKKPSSHPHIGNSKDACVSPSTRASSSA